MNAIICSIHVCLQTEMRTFHPDPVLVKKIEEYVDEGLVNVRDIKVLLDVYVKTSLDCEKKISPMNRRFYPSARDIRNIVSRCVINFLQMGRTTCRIKREDILITL